MKCTNCGFEFDEGLFCPECGTKIEETKGNVAFSETVINEGKKETKSIQNSEKKEDIISKKKKPIFLSIIAILIVFWFTAGIGSLIMTIARLVKYPEKKKSSIVLMVLHAIWIGLMVVAVLSPPTEKPVSESTSVIVEEETEAKLAEDEKEEKPTEIIEEKVDKTQETSLFGYPEQEKELSDFGFDLSKAPSKDCFLYCYAEYKAIVDHTDFSDMESVMEEALEYVSDDEIDDYVALETFTCNYSDDLVDAVADNLIQLVGEDEWENIITNAETDYVGFSINGTVPTDDLEEVATEYIKIDRIESLENNHMVCDTGDKTKEELYQIAESVCNNGAEYTYGFSKNQMRDPNAVGNTYHLDMYVQASSDPFIVSAGTNAEVGNIVNGYVDLSLVKDDIKIFAGDNIIVDGIYLGLTQYNLPVFLATAVTVH